MNRQTAMMYRRAIEQAAKSLNDEDAYDVPEMFVRWKPGVEVAVGERQCYEDKLYKCNQAHMTQEGWEPDKVPALWTEVPRPGEIPVWRQPTGAQDAYMTGDRVHYPTANDPVWISTVDNNVWEPGVYGWEEIVN